MFDQSQLMVAVLAALAFAVVLIVFAIAIRFTNNIMRGRRRMRTRLRFGRRIPDEKHIEEQRKGENRQ